MYTTIPTKGYVTVKETAKDGFKASYQEYRFRTFDEALTKYAKLINNTVFDIYNASVEITLIGQFEDGSEAYIARNYQKQKDMPSTFVGSFEGGVVITPDIVNPGLEITSPTPKDCHESATLETGEK